MELDDLDEYNRRRTEATAAIVDSSSEKKLIVAGPGTGKTFTFRKALEVCGGRGLALTFIRNLVFDLRKELEEIADVFTFHGFCKYQLHRHLCAGLERGWHYYPPLLDLVEHDVGLLGHGWSKREIEEHIHRLDESDGLIAEVLRLGTYYNAVSHTEVVYRILRHFEDHPEEIPEYPLIVVDEYQDFNELETRFIDLLATRNQVLIAGDDDQALYDFKHAEARFIRELAGDEDFERFELPYCSRCTEVVVAAVNDVLTAAIANGHLEDRLAKDFQCFVPDKQDESSANPTIIHARCSVLRNNLDYPGRFVVGQIEAIPEEDIRESHEGGYPTVLVLCSNPFRRIIFPTLSERFPQAVLRQSEGLPLEPLEAYRMLAKDEASRLGWRILIGCEAFEGSDEVLADVLAQESELADALPGDYRANHLEITRLIGRLLGDDDLDEAEVQRLTDALGRTLDEIKEGLAIADAHEREEDEPGAADSGGIGGADEPSIICTSLTGSKGLSAAYVFIVGFNNGHLPHKPDEISDLEICSLLVGLSRTRKRCYLISVQRLFGNVMQTSEFAKWIKPHLNEVYVNKDYLDG